MSVNVFALQIAASNAVSFHESAGSPPQRAQPGARKNFAAAFHAGACATVFHLRFRPSGSGIQPERPVLEIVQANAPSPLHTEEPKTKPLSAIAHDRQTVVGDARQSDMDWSEQGSRERTGEESPSPHRAAASDASTGFASATVGEVGIAGTAALSMARPVEHSAASGPAPLMSRRAHRVRRAD